MRRLGIFLFYDELGFVSEHMKRSLRAFRPYMDELIFIANGNLDRSSMDGLEDVVTQTVVRENVGYDVWGYKHGLEHVGYQKLGQFDEIVLFNYTFFAPMHDLGEMFSSMAEKPVDFWGLTEYTDPEKSFLQSYFLVSRKSLHSTQAFVDYWKTMPMITSIDDSLDFHEFRFTRNFVDAGFSYEPYIANEPHWGGNTTLTDLSGLHAKGMPVIKYRAFNFEANYLQRRGGNSPAENIRFVEEKTDYPVSEIWDYMISQTSAQDLIRNAELMKILPPDKDRAKPVADIYYAVTLRDFEQLDVSLEFLASAPKDNIWIGSPDARIVAEVKKRGYTAKKVGEADLALLAWYEPLTKVAGDNDFIVNLCDFPGERPRYDFIRTLFSTYWGMFVGDEGSTVALTKWLQEEHHIGMVFPDTNSVDGRESAIKGISRHMQGWSIPKFPNHLRKSVGAVIWPWRGNAMLRASVVKDPNFKNDLETLVPAHASRRRDTFSGVEAFLPEMVRRTRFASSLIVKDKDATGLILRSGLVVEQANDRILKLAQKFRRANHELLKPSPVTASVKPVRKKERVSEKEPVLAPLNLAFDEFTMTLSGNKNSTATIRSQSRQDVTLQATSFAELAVDEIDIHGARLFLRGWIYDIGAPRNQLMYGLFAGGKLVSGLSVAQEFRPDVAIAYPDLGLLEDTGFQLEYQADQKVDVNATSYQLVIIDTAATQVMLTPIAPFLNRGTRQAISSFFRNRS